MCRWRDKHNESWSLQKYIFSVSYFEQTFSTCRSYSWVNNINYTATRSVLEFRVIQRWESWWKNLGNCPYTLHTFRPCQGRLPRRKYMNMWPRASRSSRRLCSASTDMITSHWHNSTTMCQSICFTNRHPRTTTTMKSLLPLPKCVLMDIYRAVPVKLLCSR